MASEETLPAATDTEGIQLDTRSSDSGSEENIKVAKKKKGAEEEDDEEGSNFDTLELKIKTDNRDNNNNHNEEEEENNGDNDNNDNETANSNFAQLRELDLDDPDTVDSLNLGEKLLVKYHVPQIYQWRYLVMALIIIIIGGGLWASFTIGTASGEPQFFKPGSNLFEIQYSDDFIFPQYDWDEVIVAWGVNGIDKTNVDIYNPRDKGLPIWGEPLDLASPAAQEHIIYTFETLKKAVNNVTGKPLVNQNSTKLHCFMCDFKSWYLPKYGTEFPIKEADVFWHYFHRWLKDMDWNNKYIGWETIEGTKEQIPKVAKITFESYDLISTIPLKEQQTLYEAWSNNMAVINSLAPPTFTNGIASSIPFVYTYTKLVLVSIMVWGTIFGLVVATLVLIASTRNLVLSLFALLSILLVILCFAFVMRVIGWTIGFIESVAMTIVVGLSVDYTVHIVIAYVNQMKKYPPETSRLTLVKYTMNEIGVSIIGGAVTTASSILMLFFCQITFFSRFGQFVFINIVSSFFISFVCLLGMLLVMGPRGKTGDVIHIFTTCVNKLRDLF